MGYIGYSKSVRAAIAEDEGKRVASKIDKQWLASAGITQPVKFVKWLIREGRIAPTEWHHTSKYYNQTYYYDKHDILSQLEYLEHTQVEGLRNLSDLYREYKDQAAVTANRRRTEP